MKKRDIKRVPMSIRLEPEIKEKLEEISERTGQSQNSIIEQLIEHYDLNLPF